MNYFKHFCRRNMKMCEEMLPEDDVIQEYDSVQYLSILYEIVSASKRDPDLTKVYIMKRLRDFPILTTLLVTNETLPMIMDDVINMFVDECELGDSVVRKFLRFILSNNPEANFLIAENYITQLSNKVFKKPRTLEEKQPCYESLTLLVSLLFESSPKAKDNIWRQRDRIESLGLRTDLIPLMLKTSTEEMQKTNRNFLINFLERNYKV